MKSKKKESSTRRGPSLSSTFPAKLHKILSIPELSHIISWMPHGRSWRVLQPKLFEEKVMPKYFAHQSKYASFTVCSFPLIGCPVIKIEICTAWL